MKSLGLYFFVLLVGFARFSNGQEYSTTELAEFIHSVTEIGGERWRIEYAEDTKTVCLVSAGTFKGQDRSSGSREGQFNDLHVRIKLRLTDAPTKQRKDQYDELERLLSDRRIALSPRVSDYAGYSKSRPVKLTRKEWVEYLDYAELKRKVKESRMATHKYMSLNFVDLSNRWVEPHVDQVPAAKQLLADREQLFKLLTKH